LKTIETVALPLHSSSINIQQNQRRTKEREREENNIAGFLYEREREENNIAGFLYVLLPSHIVKPCTVVM